MSKIFLSNNELMSLSNDDRTKYYNSLRRLSLASENFKNKRSSAGRKLVTSLNPLMKDYEFEPIGIDNIPKNTPVLFVSNHSNSHNILDAVEFCSKFIGEVSVMVASDDLTLSTRVLFDSCNAVLFDRRDKIESSQSVFEMANKIICKGMNGWIFSEATWNLHPVRLIQDLKIGAILIAAITGCPIIPTVLEYVEVDDPVSCEKELYEKCIVKFCYPYFVSRDRSLVEQIQELQRIMESARARVTKSKLFIDDVNPLVYLNHVFFKKYGFAFNYDSAAEAKFLFSKDGLPVDNEYRLNENGILVPGITLKSEGKKFVKIK